MTLSSEVKEKIRKTLQLKNKGENNPMYGRKHSSKSIEKIKNNLDTKGEKNGMFNHIYSSETREKMSNSQKNRAKIECPICKKFIDPGNYHRWHGANCKLNQTGNPCYKQWY